ncbi:barstar family protein [Gordonia aichiensis]|uniref:Barstar (barnase inhibitor) domain-containing protein n=1 Tax=Gordonia aichiensis NBRC 108223 TaxID=1220583 RepID=L7KJ97_9ACTN|nr:barstar family protein [Gordonia aichiensis]GAC47793.1 hypothetical protein GOACH_04_01890 [Gordonia aichiensis NBRC 108223]
MTTDPEGNRISENDITDTGISDTGIPLARFLHGAGRHEPAVGLWVGTRPPTPPSTYEFREVTGRTMTTRAGLYDTYARAWDFPNYFGRNADAFDECMRELDDPAVDEDSPTPAGYLTDIVDADRLLIADTDLFEWFARSQIRYRDHYRDVAEPHGTFATLLETSHGRRRQLLTRWRRAGVAVVAVGDDHRR